MPQPVPSPAAEDAHPAVPATHTPDTDLDTLISFADVEFGVAQEAELDAVTAAWDGFL